MNVILHFQYNFKIFLPTFLLHNFQCNFKFIFFLQNKDSLVKVLCLMIISFHSLICVQLIKSILILKQREYYTRNKKC